MRENSRRQHMIDLIFPVILFFVFSICAVAVVLLSSHVYADISGISSANDSARTSISYVTEKIRQNDLEDAISMTAQDGTTLLCLDCVEQDTLYHTYLYYYDGALRELFVKDGTPVTLSAGEKILSLSGFTMEPISEDLIRFTCTGEDGQTVSTCASIRSGR